MRKFGLFVLTLALVTVSQSAFAQYTLRFSTGVTGSAGSTAEISNFFDHGTGDPVSGWSWGICQDANVNILSVADGATTVLVDPAFNAPNVIDGEGWTVGVVP